MLRSFTVGLNFLNLKKIIIRLLFGIKRLFISNNVKWFDLKVNLKKIPILHNIFIDNFNIIVATRWDTAHIVNKFDEIKGKKFYLIQGYETWHGLKKKVDDSYKLPLNKIVVSDYLEKKIKDELKENVNAKIINGINFDVFYRQKNRKYDSKKILMQYSNLKIKGFNDGLKAYGYIQDEMPDCELILFGLKKGKDVPNNIKFFESIDSNFLKTLYNKCDIFLCASKEEGFGLPPMEAMACGCAVVTTKFGAVPDYTLPGITALVSEPNDPETLAKNTIFLLKNKTKMVEMANNAYRYVQKFTWDKSTLQLEKEFQKAIMN